MIDITTTLILLKLRTAFLPFRVTNVTTFKSNPKSFCELIIANLHVIYWTAKHLVVDSPITQIVERKPKTLTDSFTNLKTAVFIDHHFSQVSIDIQLLDNEEVFIRGTN